MKILPLLRDPLYSSTDHILILYKILTILKFFPQLHERTVDVDMHCSFLVQGGARIDARVMLAIGLFPFGFLFTIFYV